MFGIGYPGIRDGRDVYGALALSQSLPNACPAAVMSRNRFKFDSLGVEASDVSGLRPRDSRARPGLLQKLPQSDSLCFEALDCV